MAHGGLAVGRDGSGRAVFVDGGLPGESVDARLVREQPRMALAVLARLPDRPSADRVEQPPCPAFGRWPQRGEQPHRACGGCQWQHVRYGAQAAYKRALVVDALERIGRLEAPAVAETLAMSEPWGYRNRLTVQWNESGPCLVAADGRTAVPVAACPIAHPLLAELLRLLEPQPGAGIEAILRTGVGTGDQMLVLRDPAGSIEELDIDTQASVILVGPGGTQVAAGRPYLVERLAGRSFLVPPESFFQVNSEMAEQLVRLVREAVPPGTGLLVDAFAGVGTFGLSVADRAREVVAIESDAAAVAAAVENAVGMPNITLIEGSAVEGLESLSEAPDALIVDPPRAGLPRGLHTYLERRRPPTIIYVSCEPSTLARDAGRLSAIGYRLDACQPVDMFPHTFHTETVSVFRRSIAIGGAPP